MKKNGFSLIEVLVACAIMAVGAVAMGSLMTHFFQFKKYLEVSSQYNQFLNEVEFMIQNSDKCADSFATIPGIVRKFEPGTTPYTDPNGQSYLKPFQDVKFTINGMEYDASGGVDPYMYLNPSSGVTIRNAQLASLNIPPVPTTLPDGNPGSKYSVMFRVEGRLDSNQVKGPSLKPRDYNMTLVVRNSNMRIEGCNSQVGPAEACTELGGTYDPLATDPTKKCDLTSAFGGCITGGGFSTINGSCGEVNPATGGCTCPTDFEPNESADFAGGGGKSTDQVKIYACVRCNDLVPGP